MTDIRTLLMFLRQRARKPLNFKEIREGLRLSRSESRRLKQNLRQLVRDGRVIRTKKGRYGPAPSMNLLQGVFEAHREGYGFLIPDEEGKPDYFVAARNTLGAMRGDQVLARIEREERREASIVKILSRGSKKFVGKLEGDSRSAWVTPRRGRGGMDLLIRDPWPDKVSQGDWVIAEITKYPAPGRPPEGRIVRSLGKVESPADDISLIIEEHGLRRRFPSAVKKEAASVSAKLTPEAPNRRTDYRELLTFTIDGERARDFDDAVSMEEGPDGGFILWVHIADVSHFVRPGSALDAEAERRGTSVYFPDRVLPMLPHELSSDLCSLKPGVERLAMSVRMSFDSAGRQRAAKFSPSLIRSDRRLTYTEAAGLIEETDGREDGDDPVVRALVLMRKLALRLNKRRRERGSLDFDLPEPYILLDMEGRPEDIVAAPRNEAHRIIEEFMLAANEAVARHLSGPGLAMVFRIHEKPEPEQLTHVMKFLKEAGIPLGRKDRPLGNLARILEETGHLPTGRVLHYHILRALKPARYSAENRGHFGLASSCYTHFTSPIRRYPDLMVHRILKSSLSKSDEFAREKIPEEEFRTLCLHCSRTERTAERAERESVDSLRAWFMKEKVGEEFHGLIEDVRPGGIRVRLKDFFVDGFIPVSGLTDDYYIYSETSMTLAGRHTGRKFRPGREIRVMVSRVSIEERSIIFGPA